MPGMTFDYRGAQVLVTGGTSGIGLGCARAYANAGAAVTITGRRPSAEDYPADLGCFAYRQLDVACRDAVVATAASLDTLDVLVNNAGGSSGDEWSHDGFDAGLAINLSSAYHMSLACKPLLEASSFPGGASVIGIASMTSYFGYEWTPAYGAAKAGLVQLTKTLGLSWGPSGIRANAVAAGMTRTNLTAEVIDGMPEMIDGMLARQGVKRVGTPEDIAAAVLFLTSPAASWITGQTLPVDGGFSIGM